MRHSPRRRYGRERWNVRIDGSSSIATAIALGGVRMPSTSSEKAEHLRIQADGCDLVALSTRPQLAVPGLDPPHIGQPEVLNDRTVRQAPVFAKTSGSLKSPPETPTAKCAADQTAGDKHVLGNFFRCIRLRRSFVWAAGGDSSGRFAVPASCSDSGWYQKRRQLGPIIVAENSEIHGIPFCFRHSRALGWCRWLQHAQKTNRAGSAQIGGARLSLSSQLRVEHNRSRGRPERAAMGRRSCLSLG